MTEPQFEMTPEVKHLGVRPMVFSMADLHNAEYSPALLELLSAAQLRLQELDEAARARREHVVDGFDELRRRVQRSSRRFPPSCRNLIALFDRTGKLPAISPAVDCYNLVSVESGLSLGAHDLAKIHGGVRLALSSGGETFQALGSPNTQQIQAGEYVYRDEHNILCRMDYRQAGHSALQATTRQAIFIVQGHQWIEPAYIDHATGRLSELLAQYCGGRRT